MEISKNDMNINFTNFIREISESTEIILNSEQNNNTLGLIQTLINCINTQTHTHHKSLLNYINDIINCYFEPYKPNNPNFNGELIFRLAGPSRCENIPTISLLIKTNCYLGYHLNNERPTISFIKRIEPLSSHGGPGIPQDTILKTLDLNFIE